MNELIEYKEIKAKIKVSLILTSIMGVITTLALITALLDTSNSDYIQVLTISLPIILLGDICIFLQIRSLIDLKNQVNLKKIKKRYQFIRIFYIFYYFVGILTVIIVFPIPKKIDELLEITENI